MTRICRMPPGKHLRIENTVDDDHVTATLVVALRHSKPHLQLVVAHIVSDTERGGEQELAHHRRANRSEVLGDDAQHAAAVVWIVVNVLFLQ